MATNEGAIPRDRISDFPAELLHHILAWVPIKYAARTSVLSKRWNSIWINLPYLKFGCDFLYPSRSEEIDKRMLKVVKKIILSRHQQQVAAIEKFHLYIKVHEEENTALERNLKRWMICVATSSLKELVLDFVSCLNDNGELVPYTKLPSTILSAKSISLLSLRGFSLMYLSCLDIKLSSLKTLILDEVFMVQDILQKLIFGCPLLESLQLRLCAGFTSVYVTGLVNLKLLEVFTGNYLEIIEIDAPHLEVLKLVSYSGNYPLRTCKFNTVASSCLRRLEIINVDFLMMTEKGFGHFVSQCPVLEHLTVHCKKFENINISSATLKTLELVMWPELLEAEINAPNLEKFRYRYAFRNLPTILLNTQPKLEIEISRLLYHMTSHYQLFLHDDQLAKFLGYFKGFNTVKLLDIYDKLTLDNIIIPKEKRDGLGSPLYGTKNLVISVKWLQFEIEGLVDLVDYMLWLSPQVESLSIIGGVDQNNKPQRVHKFVCRKNACEDLSSSCCNFFPVKCWLHCLGGVRFQEFNYNEEAMFSLEFVKN